MDAAKRLKSELVSMKEYAFFPGCSIPSGFLYYEKLVLRMLREFRISVKYPSGMTCCPSPFSFDIVDDDLFYTIGARNIALIEELGLDILSPCPGCTMTLSRVNKHLRSDDLLREQVNSRLGEVGKEYKGKIHVQSLLRTLYEDIGPEAISARVRTPLKGLRVAIHYGCHSFEELEEYDNAENPKALETLCKSLGAEVVKYELANECCLVFANSVERDSVLKAVQRKIDSMRAAGANCIVVICSSCFSQFDKTQEVLSWLDILNEQEQIPVFLYPELLALSMNIDLSDIGLSEHKTDVMTLLRSLDLVQS